MSGAAIAAGIGVVADVVSVGTGLYSIFGPNYNRMLHLFIFLFHVY